MNVYFDTSALVKLYVDEKGSPEVAQLLSEAAIASTSALAYVEARAAFARAQRLGFLTAKTLQDIRSSLDADWPHWAVVAPQAALLRRAADMAEGFGLRGYDSVHLASAEAVRALVGEVRFAAFDHDLNRAANLLGLPLAL